jgi:signal transduction histidine kinase
VPQVCLDAGRIAQVLYNLVDNALKYTAAGGRVTVRMRPEAGQVRVEVIDTGEGIPKERLPYLFKAFTQLEGPLRRRHGGTGLGLSLCRAVVEAHEGQIGVESELGKGSTFWFTLPLAGPGHGSCH